MRIASSCASCSSASSARTSSSVRPSSSCEQFLIIRARLFDLLQLDRLGQFRDGELAAVHHFERELHAVDLPHAREQLHGQQRVPAEFEEIVVHADRRDIEQRRPDLRPAPFRAACAADRSAARARLASGGADALENRGRSAQLGRDLEVVDRAARQIDPRLRRVGARPDDTLRSARRNTAPRRRPRRSSPSLAADRFQKHARRGDSAGPATNGISTRDKPALQRDLAQAAPPCGARRRGPARGSSTGTCRPSARRALRTEDRPRRSARSCRSDPSRRPSGTSASSA